MKYIHLTLIFSIIPMLSFSQSAIGIISGVVIEDDKTPLAFATVTLHRTSDSTLVKGILTDDNGAFEIDNLKADSYFIRVSQIGLQKYSSTSILISQSTPSVSLPEITLNTNATTLSAVTVEAQKPFIERKLDRLIVNVENSIVSAGSSILEVLERSPNVMVNQESSINLKGKSGVIVLFDGKPTPLAGTDLINYLRTIPSTNIERIEIISNPSAKYDAAGNAGIIDIRFKKDKRLGFNGNLSLSYGQGFYDKPTAGTNLNYRTKKWNLFGAYTYSQPLGFTRFYINRKFFNPDRSVAAVFDQTSFIKQPINSHNVRLGVDLFATKKTVVGLMFNTNLSDNNREGFTNSIVTNAAQQVQYTTETNNILKARNFNGFGNFNLKHTFDSTSRELTMDIDYGEYDAKTFQNFINTYFNGEYIETAADQLETDQKGLITVKSAKADYVQPLNNQAKLELGVKLSFVKTDSDIQFFDVIDGENIFDTLRSNHFIYDENINAGYINFSREFAKTDFQFGLRMEHTVTKGVQIATSEKLSRNYVNFFPSAVVNHKITENHQLTLSYSRRIDRPSYRQLNPFRVFVDPYTYVVGDPQLKPVLTNSIDFIHTYKSRYVTELNLVRSTDVITDIFVQDDASKISNQIPANLQTLTYVNLNVTIPFSINRWFNSNFTGGAFWNKYSSPLQGGSLVNQNVAWQMRSQSSFILGKNGWSAELVGMYQARNAWGLFVIKDLGFVTAGIQKVSKDKNSTFKLNVSDVFYSNRIAVVVQYQNMDFFTNRTWDGRVVTLSFTHRFGKNTVAQARRRSSGVEDEKRRAN
jgi:iron complex outermembrane recepter protein